MGVRGQVPAGNERAHVDVVGEDVVTDELAEEQDQVGELHSLAFIPGLRCRGRKEDLNNLIAGFPCQIIYNNNLYALGNKIRAEE